MASVASRARALPSVGPLSERLLAARGDRARPARRLAVPAHNSLGESLWMDEGLSIGIASQPLFDIPGVLRVDGSPPLYYMLLSVWMDVVRRRPGRDPGAVGGDRPARRSPAACGRAGASSAAAPGLICAALCAVNPFLTNYAQETRMYSLMLVLSLLATAAFLHVFAFGRRRYLPVFMVLSRPALHPQLGALPGRGRWSARWCPAGTCPRSARASGRTPRSASAALRCSTCPGCPRCCTRSSTPALPGSTRPTSARPFRSPGRCWGAARPRWRWCSPAARASPRSSSGGSRTRSAPP